MPRPALPEADCPTPRCTRKGKQHKDGTISLCRHCQSKIAVKECRIRKQQKQDQAQPQQPNLAVVNPNPKPKPKPTNPLVTMSESFCTKTELQQLEHINIIVNALFNPSDWVWLCIHGKVAARLKHFTPGPIPDKMKKTWELLNQ